MSARLEARLEKRKDGTWRTMARHVTGTGKSKKAQRGASETHADEAGVKAAQAKLVAAAEKAGWKSRKPRGSPLRPTRSRWSPCPNRTPSSRSSNRTRRPASAHGRAFVS